MAKRSREDYESEDSPKTEDNDEILSPNFVAPLSLLAATSGAVKIIHLDSPSGVAGVEMRCSLPGHRQAIFSSYEDYETHYNKAHVHRCLECRNNFPTEHYLGLHIQENHDVITSLKRERGEKTFSCFVEGCDRVCSTPQKRRMHLVDKHMFPKDYDFDVVNKGIDRRSSMLRSGRHRRKSSAVQHRIDTAKDSGVGSAMSPASSLPTESENAEPEAMEDETSTNSDPYKDKEIDDLSGAMSALNFVPPSVRFGRGRGRGRGGLSRT